MTELTNEQIHDALVLPYLNHAAGMFEEGYASVQPFAQPSAQAFPQAAHGMLRA